MDYYEAARDRYRGGCMRTGRDVLKNQCLVRQEQPREVRAEPGLAHDRMQQD